MTQWKEGDRVKLKPHPSWIGPYRRWAESGRAATVVKTFTPHGATSTVVAVNFDRARTERLEYFDAHELIALEA